MVCSFSNKAVEQTTNGMPGRERMYSNSFKERWSECSACKVFCAICYPEFHTLSVSDRWELRGGFKGQADIVSSFVFHAFLPTLDSGSALEIDVLP